MQTNSANVRWKKNWQSNKQKQKQQMQKPQKPQKKWLKKQWKKYLSVKNLNPSAPAVLTVKAHVPSLMEMKNET